MFINNKMNINSTTYTEPVLGNSSQNSNNVQFFNNTEQEQDISFRNSNSEVAKNLLNILNSEDKNNSEKIIETFNQIKTSNVKEIFDQYYKVAKESGEVTLERTFLQKLLGATRGKNNLPNANHTESLFQGILNCNSLNVGEKRALLEQLTNLLIKYAENSSVDKNRIDKFQEIMTIEINNKTPIQETDLYNDRVVNGYFMNNAYRMLFK